MTGVSLARLLARTAAAQLVEAGVRVHAARLGERATEDPDEPLQIRHQRRMRRLLDPEILEDDTRLSPADPVGDRLELGDRDTTPGGEVVDRDGPEHLEHRLDVLDVLGDELGVEELVADHDRQDRGEAERVGSGLDRQVEVGELSRLGASWIDDDHRPVGVVHDLLHDLAGLGESVAHPRVLAQEHRNLGAFDVAAGVRVVQPRLDECLAGLLLRQSVRPVSHAERRLQ